MLMQMNLIIIYYLYKKSSMHLNNNQYPLVSYLFMPSFNTYYTFVPLSPSTSQTITSNDIHSNPFYFASQIDPHFYGTQPLTSSHQSTKNLLENRDMSENQNQTNIEALQNQKSERTIYSPIILSYNGEPSMQEEKEVKVKKEKRKEKKVQEDKDYNPQADRKRKNQITYQQNQNRNIIPNQINQIFSFLQKKNKSGHLVSKLLDKFEHPSSYSVKRYYLYQSLLKNKLGHYTNQNSLKLVTELYEPKCESWPEHEQRFYNKISRVLIRHFLHQDSIFMILTSKRMKSSKKSDHIRARHQVKESVLRILKG